MLSRVLVLASVLLLGGFVFDTSKTASASTGRSCDGCTNNSCSGLCSCAMHHMLTCTNYIGFEYEDRNCSSSG